MLQTGEETAAGSNPSSPCLRKIPAGTGRAVCIILSKIAAYRGERPLRQKRVLFLQIPYIYSIYSYIY